MLCELLDCQLRSVCESFVRFLDGSISTAMGCFVRCFRGREDRRRHAWKLPLLDSSVSKSIVNCDQESMISPNRLSSLFLAEEKKDIQDNKVKDVTSGSPENVKDAKNEAKFLKPSGTMMETTIESKKASHKLRESPPWDREYDGIKNNSCRLDTFKNHLSGNQLDQPSTPFAHSQESEKGSCSSGNSPSSCVTSEQNTQRVLHDCTEGTECHTTVRSPDLQSDKVANSDESCHLVKENNGKSKSVRFEFDMNSSFSDDINRGCKAPDFSSNLSEARLSPFPTPLKLSDEMETPGTVFPMDDLPNVRTRIRSQYVNSVLIPVESDFEWKLMKDKDSDANRLTAKLSKCIEVHDISTPISEMGEKESSKGKNLNVEASLSAWLKPVKPTHNQIRGALIKKNSNFGTTPGERPIIGTVAAHWYEDQPSQVPTKWWDGNGIPNSTNKYKEDQKVSWHATTFEEMLEKALSEENSISQRKHFQEETIDFEENEESDTALSQLKSSTAHSKPVESF